MTPGEVVITRNLRESLNAYFDDKNYSYVGVLVDENTRAHCYDLVKDALPPHIILEIESGEDKKTLDTCANIWHQLTEARFDRKSLLINLGGGVIGDMGGFCAATYKRGIEFINLPTTLLAQVDASIGGKLGIDYQGFKNHIGLFQSPQKVIIYGHFLNTLPYKELRSGFAEVIKHNLIRDKAGWTNLIKTPLKEQSWYDIIAHSTRVKQEIVAEDPLEKGLRKILNFGHTIGHAVESFYLNKPGKHLLHGEAIAVGMIAEAQLSKWKSGMPEKECTQITNYLVDLYEPASIDINDIAEISRLALQDKKNQGLNIKCSLLEEIGKANYDIPLEQKEIHDALVQYNQLLPKHHQ